MLVVNDRWWRLNIAKISRVAGWRREKGKGAEKFYL